MAGWYRGGLFLKLSDINLDHVQTDKKFDLKDNFEEDIYNEIRHSCDYLDPTELNARLHGRDNSQLSYYSHNIRLSLIHI